MLQVLGSLSSLVHATPGAGSLGVQKQQGPSAAYPGTTTWQAGLQIKGIGLAERSSLIGLAVSGAGSLQWAGDD